AKSGYGTPRTPKQTRIAGEEDRQDAARLDHAPPLPQGPPGVIEVVQQAHRYESVDRSVGDLREVLSIGEDELNGRIRAARLCGRVACTNRIADVDHDVSREPMPYELQVLAARGSKLQHLMELVIAAPRLLESAMKHALKSAPGARVHDGVIVLGVVAVEVVV